jgi:alpha-L-fucosidase
VVLEEMIAYGQRVRSFTIEAKIGGSFLKIYSGTTIGRKKIATFPAIFTNEIKIILPDSKAAPVLRNIAAYKIPGIEKLGLWENN